MEKEVFFASAATCEAWNKREYELQGEPGCATPGWYWRPVTDQEGEPRLQKKERSRPAMN
jgi:hypothetical protein